MDVSTVKSDMALPYVSDQKRDTFSLCKVTNLLVRLGPISQLGYNSLFGILNSKWIWIWSAKN